jgi:phosphate transport system permease protein
MTQTGDDMADRETMTDGGETGAVPRASSPNQPLSPPRVGGESIIAPNPPENLEFSTEPVIGSTQPAAIDALEQAPPAAGAGSITGNSGGKVRLGDRIFSGLAFGAGGIVIALVVLIAIFLLLQAVPAIVHDKSNFLLSRHWNVTGDVLDFGVLNLLWTTVVASVIAMLLAVPVAIGIALFITQYAPRRLARPVAYVVDLLAAIPSIVYGIWGISVLAPHLVGVQRALYHLSAIPIFKNQNVAKGSIFDGSIVLAVMILPIITAISRDVYERTPRQNIEAAWALGATRWEMIRLAVLPFGRPGVVSGSMLGLGRALGETIAISLILSAPGNGAPFSFSIFGGGETFASKIANNAAEFADPKSTGAYIAAGLVLFVLTVIVTAAARASGNRRKEF